MTTIKGIDVSKHNGTINWSKVKSSGIKFAIIRGGFGTDTIDPKFKSNIEGAINAGLDVGVYWFSYATSESKSKVEATKCLEVLKPYKNKIKYPIFFDFEYDSVNYAKKKGVAITKTLASNMAKVFLEAVKREGYNVGLYTNIDFSNNYFTSEVLNTYDVWIAQYRNNCTYSGKYTMWQYSEKGSVSGITGNVDLNYCYKEYAKTTTVKSDNNVKALQTALNKSYNCKLSVDGSFGPKTKAAVKKYYLKSVTKNEHAKWLQQSLKNLGYNIKVDGSYGPATKKIVKQFQKDTGLKQDGYAGLDTHIKIINALK